MSELITIAVFDEDLKAQFARMLLEREGIPCFLADENLMAMRRSYALGAGGVRLQVRMDDAEVAFKLLESDPNFASALEPIQAARPKVACPRCAGTTVAYRFWFRLLALTLYLPFWGKRYRCNVCGYGWK